MGMLGLHLKIIPVKKLLNVADMLALPRDFSVFVLIKGKTLKPGFKLAERPSGDKRFKCSRKQVVT
ncbi:hypothetical protein CPBP_00425 [Candidatus Bodocaedibacter vickermanii]|uniref:Uncharacterized protein n=1 Tax=Candidatus Bodocaedibacter vickermanii TaxID=2741701 RepID=A0A7L9RT06_9PROT|nr:hypothetical protein CPBP_00425 [Candidatus Paracaedibacteraceae bacterium 'Lake Konstanz']